MSLCIGEAQTRRGARVVYAASASRMGMTASATLATKMIEAFRPEFVAMAGTPQE
jgi:nucleoside phosphorylase